MNVQSMQLEFSSLRINLVEQISILVKKIAITALEVSLEQRPDTGTIRNEKTKVFHAEDLLLRVKKVPFFQMLKVNWQLNLVLEAGWGFGFEGAGWKLGIARRRETQCGINGREHHIWGSELPTERSVALKAGACLSLLLGISHLSVDLGIDVGLVIQRGVTWYLVPRVWSFHYEAAINIGERMRDSQDRCQVRNQFWGGKCNVLRRVVTISMVSELCQIVQGCQRVENSIAHRSFETVDGWKHNFSFVLIRLGSDFPALHRRFFCLSHASDVEQTFSNGHGIKLGWQVWDGTGSKASIVGARKTESRLRGPLANAQSRQWIVRSEWV
ncbi:hypothetical protein N7541_002848 [Penicillium brevicompactum]|uniref:Uncharacterized protein n=1 Tax=Penicillium brevicompactum TaxID=5074 RepID=A0A9W9UZ86_PENBR|nr:hypothetical protein N7541_002848 [Penicillium brevicompactum]